MSNDFEIFWSNKNIVSNDVTEADIATTGSVSNNVLYCLTQENSAFSPGSSKRKLV